MTYVARRGKQNVVIVISGLAFESKAQRANRMAVTRVEAATRAPGCF